MMMTVSIDDDKKYLLLFRNCVPLQEEKLWMFPWGTGHGDLFVTYKSEYQNIELKQVLVINIHINY